MTIGFAPSDGVSVCTLEIDPLPEGTGAYAPPGTLSHTRMLVEAYVTASTGGSTVIDIKPVPGDCTAMPSCTPVDAMLLTNTCTR